MALSLSGLRVRETPFFFLGGVGSFVSEFAPVRVATCSDAQFFEFFIFSVTLHKDVMNYVFLNTNDLF